MGYGRRTMATDEPLAVLFSDIRGFTSYTAEKSDQWAYSLVRSFLQLVEEQVARHNGRVVKTYGDGAMTSFPEVRQSILSAIGMQKALCHLNQANPEEWISAGIGVTWGEAIQTKDDLFGHSINLAKRLADYAKGGQIVVSSAVKEQAQTHNQFRYFDLGDRELKGLGQQRLYEVVWRKEIARLSDEDGQLTFLLTDDYKFIMEFSKGIREQFRSTQEDLRRVVEQAKGLTRLVLRDVESDLTEHLSKIVDRAICEGGGCSEYDLQRVSASLDNDELAVTIDGRRGMRLGKGDINPNEMQDFLAKFNALRSRHGTEASKGERNE